MATNDAPVLRQNVRWGEEYVSRGLNVKLAGVIKPGVYHGFVLKPGGTMAVLVDHEPDYPRSVAVVERDGYSLTVVMEDPGRVYIPATGTWFVCIEAHYSPTQQGYQRIVVRERPEAHHIVLGKVRAGVPLNEPGETEPGSNDEENDAPSSAPGEAVVITQEMISAGEPKVDADIATLDNLTASIKAHDESVAAHGFDNPQSPLRKAIAAEATAAVNEKIGMTEGQVDLLAHAATHAQDGVDPITPESIGAASENDPRITSAITTSRLGTGLHMEEVGEGDDSQTLLVADIATQDDPGIVQPDGETVTVDEDGLLSAIGGNLQFNDELWLTESGEWTALADGLHEITCFDGGDGGTARDMGVIGGGTGPIKIGYAFLKKGVVYNAIIGAPGQGSFGSYVIENKGGQTSFSGLVNYQTIPGETIVFVDARGNGIYRVTGLGPGGGHPPNFSPDGTVDDMINASWYGSGGAASVEVISGSYRYMAGNGGQGAIRFRFWNPTKANGPDPTPAMFTARRMAAPRAAAAPATVNLYDPETGQGSVWREEDAAAKLAEGLITQEAWLEICAAKAAEERAAWLANPETEAERFELLRLACEAKLAATDKLMQPDYPISEESRAELTDWRRAIRELNHQPGAPWDGGGELTPWPEEPAVKKVQDVSADDPQQDEEDELPE